MKTPDVDVLSISADELLAWRERMQERLLPDAGGDLAILWALIHTFLWLRQALSATRVSVARLKRFLFGAKSEKRCKVFPESPGRQGKGDNDAPPGTGDDQPQSEYNAPKRKGPKPKGHGRNGVGAFPLAERIPVHHATFFSGCLCPNDGCDGKLYLLKKPRGVLRFFGQPALVAKIWDQDQWRCHFCDRIFDAALPVEALGPRYDQTAVAMVAILHYGNGFAFYRLEQHQASLQMPFPASNQSELLREAFLKLQPILRELIRQAAQFEILHNDDTGMKVLALMAQIKQSREQASSGVDKDKKERTGIQTTAIVAISLTLGYRIALYFTGRKHAGENLESVLAQRDPKLDPPIHESDGLDHNKPGTIPVLSGKCLTHGRRQFVDVITSFPEQCRHVVEALGKVYHVDAIAKERKLSPEDRLLLHQEKSGPVMNALRGWMTDKLLEKFVEPNSGLGKAIKYMLRRWEPMTLFLRKPGAPLDNNIAEQVLKKAIRLRKNSLFYKTQKGADTGDLFLSLIETCFLNGVNAHHYLTSLLKHVQRIPESPGSWMPWNYQTMLRDEPATADRCAGTPSNPSAGDAGDKGPCPPTGGKSTAQPAAINAPSPP